MMINNIRARLDLILNFMQPYWEFVNCHMVNFLTDELWHKHVPAELQAEIKDISCIRPCIEAIFWSNSSTETSAAFPEFKQFLQNAKNHSLNSFEDVFTKLSTFQHLIGTEGTQIQTNIKDFLSYKKKHEVELAAHLIHGMLKHSHDEVVIVDAGDGKGYLSSRLALEYGYKVLGVDSNESNTANAGERNRKLQRMWNGLKERAALEADGVFPTRKEKKESTKNSLPVISEPGGNYKTVSKFISTELDLTQLITEHFPDVVMSTASAPICLTGLHTCGNLATTCLRVYHEQAQCKFLCNIGCCYHLLKETYSDWESFGNPHILNKLNEAGFPMSQYLQSKRIKLGRNARMLAAQSVERVLSAKEMPNVSLFYRALLEILICETHPQLKGKIQIGKIRHFDSFAEYTHKCLQKYPFLGINKCRIETVQKEYENEKQYLDLFYLLRISFGPILEGIILLDRLLYLHELGYSHSYLIPLFDPIISPRHCTIVSIKK